MTTAKRAVDMQLQMSNFVVLAWLPKDPSLPTSTANRLGSTLLVERIGVFPSSGDIHRPTRDPFSLLAHLKNLYAHGALDVDERDGLKVIFTDWRFLAHIPASNRAIVINVETRRDPDLLPLKTAELLSHLEDFENRLTHYEQ